MEKDAIEAIAALIDTCSDEGHAPITGRDARRLLGEVVRLRGEIERIKGYTTSVACLSNPFATLQHIGDVCNVALGGPPSPVGYLVPKERR